MKTNLLTRIALGVSISAATGTIATPAVAQQSRQVPAYDKSQTRTVLTRSVFYLPLFGAVYREKFAALVAREPGVRYQRSRLRRTVEH